MRGLVRYFLFLLSLFAMYATPVAQEHSFPAKSAAGRHLQIASVTDIEAIRPVIAGFQKSNPAVEIRYVQMNSLELDKEIQKACSSGTFFADLVISSAVAEQVRLVNNGCASPLQASFPPDYPPWALWQGSLAGLTFEPAVIVYNRQAFSGEKAPQTRFDLVDLLRQTSRFDGKIGTYDIERSGVGFLFAFQDEMQATTWGRLLESFGRNGVRLFSSSADIIDRVADGRMLLGYNVLGSYAMARQQTDSRIGVAFPSDYTLALSRAAFVPNDASEPGLANDFIEYAVSRAGRAQLTGVSHLLSPVTGREALASYAREGGIEFDGQALRPIALSPRLLTSLDKAKRAIFLRQWRQSLVEKHPQ